MRIGALYEKLAAEVPTTALTVTPTRTAVPAPTGAPQLTVVVDTHAVVTHNEAPSWTDKV